jgi:uncharacterized protein (TIGR02145 family)/prepilin-type N-terminal cleavage/methylation domain-containing protein
MLSIVNKTKHSAFTLIELLVVIAIIAILSTLSVVALTSARAKARDAKRLADIKNTQTALDLYYNEYGVYPTGVEGMDQTSTSYCLSDQGIATTCGAVVYAGSLPLNPTSGLNYLYTPTSSQLSYTIAFTLETGTGDYEAGGYQATPDAIIAVAEEEEEGWTTCGDPLTFDGLPYGSVTADDGHCWLDRNLGATRVAQSSTDYLAYGDLYQWGRAADGHEHIAWADWNVGTPDNSTTSMNADIPDNSLFITESVSPKDWRVNPNNYLWESSTSTNNPCPTGWHVPTNQEWIDVKTAEGINSSATAASSSLRLTAAGYRYYSSGSLYNVGSYGNYWSSSVVGSGSYYLVFDGGGAGMYRYSRAFGCTVRCLKDY